MGQAWNWIATSVAFFGILLPALSVEGTPGPPPVVHEHLERDECLPDRSGSTSFSSL